MQRHLPGCLLKHRNIYPQATFEAVYNMFTEMLRTGALSTTYILDLLRRDFLDEIERSGRSHLLGQTFFTCNMVEGCSYRCLEKADMNKHRGSHMMAGAILVKWNTCEKCKKVFVNKSNYYRHVGRKTSCI